MLIFQGKNRYSVNEKILDLSNCINFSCTSKTGMCILVKIRQKVTGTITLDSYTIIGQKIYKIGIKFD